MIDRISPTRRPSYPAQGYHQWRSLLFLHWPVPIEAMRRVVPEELSLDLYDGKAWVGVVPFLMQGVRPWWWPAKLGFRFLETNVRTYVHYRGRPGVYFFSLDANSRPAVWAARKGWGLPYHHATMRHHRRGDEVEHRTQRSVGGLNHNVRYRVGEPMGRSEPETVEYFFLERYLLFVERRGGILTGQVHHDPYPVRKAEVLDVEDQLIPATGLSPVDTPPHFAHYSDGVDVEVFALQKNTRRS